MSESEMRLATRQYLDGFGWAAGNVARVMKWDDTRATYTRQQALQEHAVNAGIMRMDHEPYSAFAQGLEAGYLVALGQEAGE